tara:strand:+ start:185 stop:1021 length:837 start_codon:yes stop_codon:yes gene_type:complete
MGQISKAQTEFDSKSKSFIKYINDNNISLSERILKTKYKSFLRLRNGHQIHIDTYEGIIKAIEETSKNKLNTKFDYQILNKFKLNEKIDRSEIITFEFKDAQSFFDYIYGIWEQEQETEIMNYKKRFIEFINQKKSDFLKKKFIKIGATNSVIPKCEINLQSDPEIRKNISTILDQAVTPAFRYGFPIGAAWDLKKRIFLEYECLPNLDFLLQKKVKIAVGHKLCPQTIKFDEKKNEISLNTNFIWLIKFGGPKTIEINNLFTDSQIFEDFENTYLSD